MLPFTAQAQTPPPVDAGSLLEQQRNNPIGTGNSAVPALAPAPAPAAPGTPSATAAKVAQKIQVRVFKLVGNQRVPSAVLQAALARWVGPTIGLAELHQATLEIESIYRSQGWLAQAHLLTQDITLGEVQITINEATMGQLQVLNDASTPVAPGLQRRAERLLHQALPSGQPLSTAALERAIAIADDVPGLNASTYLQAGATPGSTDVVVHLRPQPLQQTDISLDNAGSRAVGQARLTAQLTLNSPWGQGEQFKLLGSATPGSSYLRVAASTPIDWLDGVGAGSWRLGANASALRYQVLDSRNTTTGLPPKGTGTTLGLDLQYPLVALPLAHWLLSLGLETKNLDNQDDTVTPGQRKTTSRVRSQGATISLWGNQIDKLGGGGATNANLVYSSSSLQLDGSPASYLLSDANTARTAGHFDKLRWSASRVQVLPTPWSLLLQASGQWASRNLDSSERFYLGGMNGVRAYPSSEGGGSNGQLLSVELRRALGAQWQVSAFYDWGQVQQFADNQSPNGTPLVAHNRNNLAGRGLALEWHGSQSLTIKGTWAARNGGNPVATANGNDTDGSLVKNRVWLSANISF